MGAVRRLLAILLTGWLAAVLIVVSPGPAVADPPGAGGALRSGELTLRVRPEGRDAQPLARYSWMITRDDTGNPGTAKDPLLDRCLSADPGECPWPSRVRAGGLAQIIAVGDQRDFATRTLHLPGGSYLVSVTANGYRTGGAHFRIDGDRSVDVALRPAPRHLVSLAVSVFDDVAPLNGVPDRGETGAGLSGFEAHVSDGTHSPVTDFYGNPLCTAYVTEGGKPRTDPRGRPVVDRTVPARCVSGPDGSINVPNLLPGRYSVTVSPPAGHGWVQTTSSGGTRTQAVWLREGDATHPGGIQIPSPTLQFGFARATTAATEGSGTRALSGSVVVDQPYVARPVTTSSTVGVSGLGQPRKAGRFWVAVSDPGHGNRLLRLQAGNDDGTYRISGLRDGNYLVSIWDDSLSARMSTFPVTVRGSRVRAGETTLQTWSPSITGTVFEDTDGNGRRDRGEHPVSGVTVSLRGRDGSAAGPPATTDSQGRYTLAVPTLDPDLVIGLTSDHLRATGVTWQAANDPKPTAHKVSANSLALFPLIGAGGDIDWGVVPLGSNAPRGITGDVVYGAGPDAVGVPGVRVNLYRTVPCTVHDPRTIAIECRDGHEIVPLNAADPAFEPARPVSSSNRMFLDTPNPDPRRGDYVTGGRVATMLTAGGSKVGATGRDPSTMTVGQFAFGGSPDGTVTEGDYLIGVESPRTPVGQRAAYATPRLDQLVRVTNGHLTPARIRLTTSVPMPVLVRGPAPTGAAPMPTGQPDRSAPAMSNVPVGIYDETGRLIDTAHTDLTGVFAAFEPATGIEGCPTAVAPCSVIYRISANDPGEPGRLNADYDPRQRTVSALVTAATAGLTPVDPQTAAGAGRCVVTSASQGDTGRLVEAIQLRAGVPQSGTFDTVTLKAIQKLQLDHQLGGSALVGPATWRLLGGYPCLSPQQHDATLGQPAALKDGALDPRVAPAVALAQTYLGVPYVWGGSTPSGFDCSGLTSFVYARLGLHIPRTASAQQRFLTPTTSPVPGDLVFLGVPAYHVGIYAGDGYMIDAPHPGAFVRRVQVPAVVAGYGHFSG